MKFTIPVSLMSTAAIVLTTGLFAASANALTLGSSSGTWSNTIGGSNISYGTVGSESQVRWGVATPNSGLGFTGVGSSSFGIGSIFQVGTLRHFNNPVQGGTAASSVNLTTVLNFSNVGGSPLSKSFDFNFGIDETPNSGDVANCPYVSTIPCSDKIFIPTAFPTDTFTIGNTAYTLQLLGFSKTVGGSIVNSFISDESQTNTAYLYGKITAAPVSKDVPEPTTLAGVSLLGAYLLTQGRKLKVKAA